MNAKKLFSFHQTLFKKISPYILIRNGMLIDQKMHFMITFFKIIPCKRFYALLALKVGCQNIEGDLNIFGIFKLNLDAICDGNLSWVY